MALFYNGTNIPASANVYINNQAASQVLFNNALVWKKERTLFYNGSFGELGTPVQGLSEGYSFRTSATSGANWLINCDGRSDWWFPYPSSGFTNVHISVVGTEGAAGSRHCYAFSSTATNIWGNSANAIDISNVGTYTLAIPSSSLYIGVQALMGGVYISRIWLD